MVEAPEAWIHFDQYSKFNEPQTTKPLSIMKKLIYVLVIAFVSSMALTSCTEDEVRPTKPSNGGGSGSLDPL